MIVWTPLVARTPAFPVRSEIISHLVRISEVQLWPAQQKIGWKIPEIVVQFPDCQMLYCNYWMGNFGNWTTISEFLANFFAAQRERLFTQWAKNLNHWVTKFSWLGDMSSSCNVKRWAVVPRTRSRLCDWPTDHSAVAGLEVWRAASCVAFSWGVCWKHICSTDAAARSSF